jgi:predicted ABC-type ATPase
VNADLIAAGLAPFAPESVPAREGRLMLEELQRHFLARTSFAFETTLSGAVTCGSSFAGRTRATG